MSAYCRNAKYGMRYGVATISRLLQIIGLFWQNLVPFIGLFCKRVL